MPLFALTPNKSIDIITEQTFRLEKDIQQLVEKNINTLLKLKIVCSEFKLNQFRIDTLAFDKESKAFVIIEYKRDKNFSVIDQGYAYLALMLNNKADFILEYNERQKDSLKRTDVDWSQSKVLFISPGFTTYQREAINFKDLPIELHEIKCYSNNTITFNKIQQAGATETIKTLSGKDDTIAEVSKEVKVYTEEEHLSKVPEEIKELYEVFKQRILDLGDIEVQPKKLYIAFIGIRNIVDICPLKSRLKIWINLNLKELDDSKKICRNVSNVGHWGNGDYELNAVNDEDIDYIMSLIKQSWKKNKK